MKALPETHWPQEDAEDLWTMPLRLWLNSNPVSASGCACFAISARSS
jgi:hypothetical protein